MRGEQSTGWVSRIRDFAGRWLDKRDRERLPANFNVTIEGAEGLSHANGVDANRRSIGVVSRQPLERGLLVFIGLSDVDSWSDVDYSGFAYIRHCTPCADGTFRLGLKFREPLHRKRAEPGGWTYRRVSYSEYGTWDDAAEILALSPQ